MSRPITIDQRPAPDPARHIGNVVTSTVITALYGGWLLMLVMGIAAGVTGDPRWAVGYWTAVLIMLCARPIVLGLTYRVTPGK